MTEADVTLRLKATGRNDACPCGSGKKYKKCHMAADEAQAHSSAQNVSTPQESPSGEAAAAEAKAKKAALAERSGGRSKEAAAAKPSRDTRPKNLPRRRAV